MKEASYTLGLMCNLVSVSRPRRAGYKIKLKRVVIVKFCASLKGLDAVA